MPLRGCVINRWAICCLFTAGDKFVTCVRYCQTHKLTSSPFCVSPTKTNASKKRLSYPWYIKRLFVDQTTPQEPKEWGGLSLFRFQKHIGWRSKSCDTVPKGFECTRYRVCVKCCKVLQCFLFVAQRCWISIKHIRNVHTWKMVSKISSTCWRPFSVNSIDIRNSA